MDNEIENIQQDEVKESPPVLTGEVADELPEELTRKVNKGKRSKRTKLIAAGVTGALLVTGIGIGVYYFNPFTGYNVIVKEYATVKDVAPEDKKFAAQKKEFIDTFKLDAWQLNPDFEYGDKPVNKEVLSTYSSSPLYSAFLPSEEDGYTSDPDKKFLPGTDNKIFNPKYTKITRERFTSQFGYIVDSLLHQGYGKPAHTWGSYGKQFNINHKLDKMSVTALYGDAGAIISPVVKTCESKYVDEQQNYQVDCIVNLIGGYPEGKEKTTKQVKMSINTWDMEVTDVQKVGK